MTKTSVLKFIRRNGLINPELIRTNISNKKNDITRVLRFCEELFSDNRILKTGPHTFTLKRRNPDVKKTINDAIRIGSRLQIVGYGLGNKKKYKDVIFPEKITGGYVNYKNITKDGFKNRRINTILSIKKIK